MSRLPAIEHRESKSFNYPVLKMTLHSHSQSKTKNGNYKPSRYQLDMKPFWQVLGLAERIFKEWCCGAPRLKEWINPEDGEPYPPNQGYCRELAAKLIADSYRPAAPTTGDPLVDALLADEMEARAEWKQPRL